MPCHCPIFFFLNILNILQWFLTKTNEESHDVTVIKYQADCQYSKGNYEIAKTLYDKVCKNQSAKNVTYREAKEAIVLCCNHLGNTEEALSEAKNIVSIQT